jgi:hypothetical protein
MIIRCCKECPFFQDSPLTAGLMKILTGDLPYGMCGYDPSDDRSGLGPVWSFTINSPSHPGVR